MALRDDCVGAAGRRHVGVVGDGHGKIADREDGVDRSGSTTGGDESVELREARKRIKFLEQEAEVMRHAVGYLRRDVNPE
jgi:hypothetical protein